MKISLKQAATALIVTAFLQSAALGAMILDRAHRLETGKDILLKTAPIDPRDLFRGEYVSLNYDISRLDLSKLGGDAAFTNGESVYVTLTPQPEENREILWAPAAVHKVRPDISGKDVVIRGDIQYVMELRPQTDSAERGPDGVAHTGDEQTKPCMEDCQMINVAYGIESYFLPEGQGKALEEARDSQTLAVLVAVDDGGKAAIKGLSIDGKLSVIEPLF